MCKLLDAFALAPCQPKVSAGINKISILSDYQEFCSKQRYNNQVYTIVKCKTSPNYNTPHTIA
jgi:hypothetical protein